LNPPDESALEIEIGLLRRVAQGDERAFSELYDRWASILFTMAVRVLNNAEAAEDVLQDVFLHLWEKAPVYDPARGKPLNWAVTLVRNRSIDRLRSSERRSRLLESVQRESASGPQFDERTSSDSVISAEAARSVREAMRLLSDEQRTPLELAFYSSQSQTEIAEQLGLPLGTVKARMRRGMLKLREALQGQL
jgi:RNA polymerase sigma-70 factor (ECF subfamily)